MNKLNLNSRLKYKYIPPPPPHKHTPHHSFIHDLFLDSEKKQEIPDSMSQKKHWAVWLVNAKRIYLLYTKGLNTFRFQLSNWTNCCSCSFRYTQFRTQMRWEEELKIHKRNDLNMENERWSDISVLWQGFMYINRLVVSQTGFVIIVLGFPISRVPTPSL